MTICPVLKDQKNRQMHICIYIFAIKNNDFFFVVVVVFIFLFFFFIYLFIYFLFVCAYMHIYIFAIKNNDFLLLLFCFFSLARAAFSPPNFRPQTVLLNRSVLTRTFRLSTTMYFITSVFSNKRRVVNKMIMEKNVTEDWSCDSRLYRGYGWFSLMLYLEYIGKFSLRILI